MGNSNREMLADRGLDCGLARLLAVQFRRKTSQRTESAAATSIPLLGRGITKSALNRFEIHSAA